MKKINLFISEALTLRHPVIYHYVNEKLTLNKQTKLHPNVNVKKEYEKIKQSADEAISLYNSNGPKQKIIENLENFGFNLMTLIESIRIDEISLRTNDKLYAVYERSSYGALNNHVEPIKIIRRKNDDRIALSFGFMVNLYWKNLTDIDKLKFKMQNIEYESKHPININVYKNGNIEISYRANWDHQFFPQDKAYIQKELNDIFKDINIEWQGWNMISKNKLSNLPPLKDALKNSFELSDFTQNVGWNSSYRRQELLDKFIKILKMYDSKASFKDTDTRKDKDKYANIIGEINFNGKTHQFELLYRYNGYNYIDFEVTIDKEKVFYIDSHTIHWDPGLSSTDHNIIVDDKITQILK